MGVSEYFPRLSSHRKVQSDRMPMWRVLVSEKAVTLQLVRVIHSAIYTTAINPHSS